MTGFEGSAFDLSDYVPDGKLVTWGIDEAEQALLRRMTASMPELRSIIARARPHHEILGLLIINATVPELDELYSLVEGWMDVARGKRELAILDGLLSTLCTSMDGF